MARADNVRTSISPFLGQAPDDLEQITVRVRPDSSRAPPVLSSAITQNRPLSIT